MRVNRYMALRDQQLQIAAHQRHINDMRAMRVRVDHEHDVEVGEYEPPHAWCDSYRFFGGTWSTFDKWRTLIRR